MEFTIAELSLPLVHTFTISRGSETRTHSALMRLRWNGLEGFGEAAPVARYGESVASIDAYFSGHALRANDPYALETLLGADMPPAARCLLDCALHDLIGKDLDRPLWRLLGLDPERTPVTSFTIGLDTLEVMLAKVDAISEHPILKIKLDGRNDIETIAAIRNRYTGTLRIDANEAWTPESAVATLNEIGKYDIEFCEQPIAAGNPAGLRYIRERTRIPLVTDEDSKDARDLPALVGCVDGINIKLVKCGGIRGALEMIHTARALGFRIMLGCMVESAVLATAAAQLSPLVDWADLDGPFLTSADPFSGVTYAAGKLVLPQGPGLGIIEREPASRFER